MTAPEAAAATDDYRKVVRKVGFVLALVAALSVGACIAAVCIRSGPAFRNAISPVFLVAISAATFAPLLIRRGLEAAWGVATYSAFLLTAIGGLALGIPLVLRMPLRLVWLYLRLQPLIVLAGVLSLAAFLVLLWWVYRTLAQPAVLDTICQQAGSGKVRPSVGFILGAAVVAFLLIVVVVLSAGERDRVREVARQKVGPGYELFVTGAGARSSGGGPEMVSGGAIAYNDHEIRSVEVEFER